MDNEVVISRQQFLEIMSKCTADTVSYHMEKYEKDKKNSDDNIANMFMFLTFFSSMLFNKVSDTIFGSEDENNEQS